MECRRREGGRKREGEREGEKERGTEGGGPRGIQSGQRDASPPRPLGRAQRPKGRAKTRRDGSGKNRKTREREVRGGEEEEEEEEREAEVSIAPCNGRGAVLHGYCGSAVHCPNLNFFTS